MKERNGGCGPAILGIGILSAVGLFGYAGYSLFTYADEQMGQAGVGLLLGIFIGIPVLIILIVLVGAIVLGVMHMQNRTGQHNSELMGSVFDMMGKFSSLVKHGRQNAPAGVLEAWREVEPEPLEPARRIEMESGWGSAHEIPRFTTKPTIDK